MAVAGSVFNLSGFGGASRAPRIGPGAARSGIFAQSEQLAGESIDTAMSLSRLRQELLKQGFSELNRIKTKVGAGRGAFDRNAEIFGLLQALTSQAGQIGTQQGALAAGAAQVGQRSVNAGSLLGALRGFASVFG